MIDNPRGALHERVLIEGAIEGMCPSTNHMYSVQRHRKFLTKEGKAFKADAHGQIVEIWKKAGMPVIPDTAMLKLALWFRFPRVFTKGPDAKSKFFVLDVSNRIKIIEDALKEALGFDDSQNFIVCSHKVEGPPAIYFWLTEIKLAPAWPLGERPKWVETR